MPAFTMIREHEADGTIPTNGRFLFYELEQAGVVPKHYLRDQGREETAPASRRYFRCTDASARVGGWCRGGGSSMSCEKSRQLAVLGRACTTYVIEAAGGVRELICGAGYSRSASHLRSWLRAWRPP